MESPGKILWVEDDTDIIGDVVNPIRKLGYAIDIVETLSEFRNLKENINEYALVILDLIIPQQDNSSYTEHPGIELMRILRNEWHCQISVIVLTVVKASKTINELHQYDVKEFLFKPVRSQILKDAVLNALK